MTDVLEQLRKAVGDPYVLSGAQVHADYTHDEALTARPVDAAGRRAARVDGRGRRDPADGQPSCGSPSSPGAAGPGSRADASPWPTAS